MKYYKYEAVYIKSYAVMSEDEMMYMDGGAMSVSKAAKYINIGVIAILAAVGIGFGVGSILWFWKKSVNGLVVSGLKRAITSVIASIGFSVGSGLYSILSSINPKWSIGYGIADYIDNHESGKRKGNGIIFG